MSNGCPISAVASTAAECLVCILADCYPASIFYRPVDSRCPATIACALLLVDAGCRAFGTGEARSAASHCTGGSSHRLRGRRLTSLALVYLSPKEHSPLGAAT